MNTWETPFDESMLGENANVVINCPEEFLAQELMELLGEHGVVWCAGSASLTDHNNWHKYKEKTCYHVVGNDMAYDRMSFYDRFVPQRWIKCTFYGSDTTDFEAANNEKLIEFLTEAGV